MGKRKARARARPAAVVLLVLLAAVVLSASLAATALALPTFTAPPSPQTTPATPACETCHGSAGPGTATAGLHALATHSTLPCSTCHTVSPATPPTPGPCGGCHQGVAHIVTEPTHSTLGCQSAGCHPVAPAGATITSITPASAASGATVTIAGTGFGATQGTGTITFGGTAATVTSWSDTKIVAKVPAGLTTGPVDVVVTPQTGTASTAFSFTVLTASKITIKLTGLKAGAIARGKTLTVKGVVTPVRASKVTITLQRKVATKWVKMKVLTRTSNATSGAYSAKYKPLKKGSWRVMAKVAKTTTATAAKTKWKTFRVK